MGCDIHMTVEVKRNGKWEYVPTSEKYKVGEFEDGGDKIDYEKWFADPMYFGRNYDLFAILADVRNGRGFAGTGTGFKPISGPRGVPSDAGPEYLKEVDRWGGDGHSHSHLTLAELLAYDWNQTTAHRGFVDGRSYAIFKEKGKPDSWCGDVYGPAKLTNAAMDGLLAAGGRWKEYGDPYTQVEWTETYRESGGSFPTRTLPALAVMDSDPANVRIVFFFDN